MTSFVFRAASACVLASTLGACQAQSAPGGKPPGPPPEAVQACQGKTAGAQASITGRDGRSFTGVCENVDGVLALRPSHGNGGPPPR
jgi:hypothetical protein